MNATSRAAIPLRLGSVVGRNVRRARLTRGLTVVELARSAELSRGSLTELEGGRGNPTVDTVAALARVLGLAIGDLMSEAPGSEPQVVRAAEGHVVQRDNVRFRLLHRVEASDALFESWEAALSPGRHRASPLPLGTIVHAHVVHGAAELGPLAAPVEVGAGDALVYRADTPAVFDSLETAVVSLVVAYAGVGAAAALSRASAPAGGLQDA
jgi:transcriptional regulator with XRE-family HTH domain